MRVLFLILAFALAVCSPAADGGRIRVVTSLVPLYCWTLNVAGDLAIVENLLPSHAEPHDYAFTPGDARKLTRADLIVVNGLGMETWLPRFLRSAPGARTRLVTTSAGLETQLIGGHAHEEHGHNHDHTSDNPHVWLDPFLAAHGVSNITAALQRIDPRHAAGYASNAQAYIARLHRLHSDLEQALGALTNRAIVTYHDAFPYFARRYQLEIAGVVEEVPDVNPTPKYLARLGRTMRQRGIREIFVAPGASSRLSRRIALDLRVRLVELDTFELGAAAADAYENAMRNNVAVLTKHLR